MSKTILSQLSVKTVMKVAGGGLGLAYLTAPDATTYSVTGLAAVGIVWSGYWVTDWLIEIPHRWNWITPLHRALASPLGVDPDTNPKSYIKVPRGYQKREEVGKVILPKEFTGIDQNTSASIIKNKLGLSDVSVTFRMAGRNPHLVIRQMPRPPAKVMYIDHQVSVAKAKESAPLIGIGPKDRQVSVDLDAESPHILVAASTGGGKSVITRTMTCQMLHNGSQMVVLDFKRISHRWASTLPQVDYCKDISEIHDALVALGQEGHRRNKVADDWIGDGDPDVGPRMAILVEEANATITKLKRYWNAIRKTRADADGPADPKESPAIDALREIMFMGRAVKMHVLLVAQSATATALGGPEVRECFATRILARYTQNAWKMLVPEVTPIPRSTRHIGRAQVVLGGVATETQVLFMSDQEATEWAMSGTVADPPSMSRRPSRHTQKAMSEAVYDEGDPRDVTPHLTLVKAVERRYSLAEAAREGIVPMKADALRQAKRRGGFPAGDGGTWTAAELQEWYASRSA